VNVGVGYAISINQIKHFLGSLRSGRIVDHATLGARVASDADGRAVVSDVLEDGDAFRRGLRIGDEIVSFGGRPVLTPNAFKNVLGIFPVGYRVPLVFRSRGTTHGTYIRLAGVHHPEELLEKMRGSKMPKEELPPAPEPDAPKEGDKPKEKPKQKGTPILPKKFKLPFGNLDDEEEEKVPDIVAKHFKERSGYANYYFNEVERKRVWDAFARRFDPSHAGGAWTIRGEELPAGNPGAKVKLEVTIDDRRVQYVLPSSTAVLAVSDDLTTALEPVGSGGLTAALSVWRRLIVEGPEKFGDLTYLGTFPLPGAPTTYDVLFGRHAGVMCRYYFEPTTGDLACVEMQTQDEADPCELVFADYGEKAGRWLPKRIEVRHGDGIYAVIVPQEWNFGGEVKP
jgi:hypothetical protein